MPGQARQVAHRILPGVEQLMLGSVGNVNDSPWEKVVALVVEDHETLAALYVHRFLAVKMLAGVPANRDFSSHKAAPAGRKSQLGGNHQSCVIILTRPYPLEMFRPYYPRRI